MTAVPRLRRCACAAVAVMSAGLLLHAQVARALITRGDDAFRNGATTAAFRAYRRAVWFDPRSAAAADRLAFTLTLQHRDAQAREAVDVVTHALDAESPAALYADRGLAEMQLRRWPAAESDFATAGRLGRDPRYDHFAARMALRRGDRPRARALASLALMTDPHFSPAHALLRALR